MKKNISRLLALVGTLSASEKRYASVFLSRFNEDKNGYGRLFDRLLHNDRLTDPLLSAARCASLQDKILDALRLYHNAPTIDVQLRKLLLDVDLLFHKRLYTHCLDKLKEAHDIAWLYERRTAALEILRFEAAVLKSMEHKQMQQKLEDNHRQQVLVLAQLNAENEERRKLDIAELNVRHRLFSDDEDSIVVYPPFIYDEKAGFQYNYCRLSCVALRFSRRGEMEQAYQVYKTLLDGWRRFPHLLDAERLHLKRTLSNVIVVCQYLGNLDEADAFISELQAIPADSSEEEAEKFQTVKFAQLLQVMNRRQWEQLEPLVKTIEEGLAQYRNKINKARVLSFRFNIAVSWYILENWGQVLKMLNSIIDGEKTEHRQDIQALARLMRLPVYYELGKSDLLDYECINVERYLRSRKQFNAFESFYIRIFKKLPDISQAERIPFFRNMKERALPFNSEGNESPVPGYVELILWLRHQAEQQPMRTLLTRHSDS